MTRLTGKDEVSVPKNALIKFSYPAIDDPLYIHSGANAIQWTYHLNTQSTPTLGGEVVQVLSAMVGPITITGQTAGLKTNQSGKLKPGEIHGWKDFNGNTAYGPNHELRDIVAWFVKYMTLAGTDNTGNAYRNERAIYFEYPERGWNFAIMPTSLKGFRYDKNVISPQWSITAEIVSNNALDYFAGVTMNSFTDDLLTTNAQLQGQIGLSHFAETSTENNNPNFGQTGDHGSTNPFLNPDLNGSVMSALTRMGDNFQGLVAAWSSGDFAHFGFGAALDANGLPKNVDAVYQKLFGNTLLGSLPGYSQSGSGSGDSPGGSWTYTGSNQTDAAAVQVANAWSAKGMPPELGIAVALHESTLNPDAYQGDYANSVSGDGAVGMFQTFYHSLANGGAGRGASTSHANEIKAAQAPLTLGQAPPKGYKVTNYYSAAHQCEDAAGWFQSYKTSGTSDDALARWAFRAQGGVGYTTDNTTSGNCTAQFANDLTKARSILKQLTPTGGSGAGYANPFPDGWVPNRLDQGYDGTFTKKIVAPFSGQIVYAGTFQGWKGSRGVAIKADNKLPFDSDTMYFIEGVNPAVKTGDRVKVGQTIATPAINPYNGVSGNIEFGMAQNVSVGQQPNPLAQSISNPKDMVLQFAAWAKNTLGVPGSPTDISGAGYP